MWKLLANKWMLGASVIVVLGAIIAWQELRYKDTLLSLQGKENALLRSSESLTALSSKYADQQLELIRYKEVAERSQRVSKDVAVQVKALRQENTMLKDNISVLKKENEDVQIYLNTNVPDSVSNSLRQ